MALGLQTLGFAQFTLTVQESPASADATLTTYRFYVNMQDATDKMSAVYGDEESNMIINAPAGVFNSEYNSSWNASGVNPAFLPVFPELADDTYATIRLDGPAASSGLDGAADPSIVEDEAQPVTPFFLTDGATSLISTTLTGCAWYVLNTASNALPDENLQMLILQITTGGTLDGTINFQVFPLGDGTNAEYYSIDFNGSGTFSDGNAGPVAGCTDPTACNFNPLATEDDGTCTGIPEGACDCDGNVLDALGVCGGDCLADADGNGICDGEEVYGCINDSACNYNPDANLDDPDEDCVFPEEGFCCEGLPDMDGDGICDEQEVAGCTDPFACNYDGMATDDDGTCEYCGCSDEAYTLTVESAPAIQAGLTTYRVYVNMNGENDFLSAVYGEGDTPLQIDAPDGVFNSIYSTSWSAAGINPALFVAYPELQDDSYATIGLTVSATLGDGTQQDPTLADGPDNEVSNFFTTEGAASLATSEFPGSSWFVLNGASNGYADEDGRVLVMQVTTAGALSGTLNYQVFAGGDQEEAFYVTSSFDGVGTFGQTNVCGCTAAGACNYDGTATIDDGSCEYESCDGCMDEDACNYDPDATIDSGNNCLEEDAVGECGGDCFADADGDGICDEVVLTGCTDPDACNYVPEANTNDGSCTYAEQYYDCEGNCLMDTDMDGVCDELEVVGCTDETACNYNELATDDDGMCEFAEQYYDCDGNCLMDMDMDGVCDELEVAGCTDETACNYDELATDDDGTCEYAVEFYDCEGNCLNDADEDGVCDELEVEGCTNVDACNYDELATEDDGSCLVIGEACDDGDEATINDTVNEQCECEGEPDSVEEAAVSFAMFPNPTAGVVTLQVSGFHAQATIQVMDAAGRVVMAEENVVLQGAHVMDVSALSNGTYNVMVSDERGVTVRRLSVQR